MNSSLSQFIPDMILYGGSFDPPHKGHVQAVEKVSLLFPKAKFVIVPGRCPAVAGNKLKRPEISFEERVNMCRLAFSTQILKSKISVSLVEATLPLPNYTLNTVKEFKKNFSSKNLALLIGSDQFRVFHHWFKPAELLKNCSLIVVKRENDIKTTSEFISTAYEVVDGFIPTDHTYTIEELPQTPFPTQTVKFSEDLFPIYLVDISICRASSTDIRNLLKESRTVPDSWIDKNILEYIKNNGLYSDETSFSYED